MRDRADCLYRMAAGGSRERLDVRQVYGPLYPSNTDAMSKTLRWAIPGSSRRSARSHLEMGRDEVPRKREKSGVCSTGSSRDRRSR